MQINQTSCVYAASPEGMDEYVANGWDLITSILSLDKLAWIWLNLI